MQINISTQQGRVPITILQLNGDLDASNYTEPIQKAQELFAGGVRDLVIDLSNVPHISSAGLMAIHTGADLQRHTDARYAIGAGLVPCG
jgi:anti-anti-sigma factor